MIRKFGNMGRAERGNIVNDAVIIIHIFTVIISWKTDKKEHGQDDDGSAVKNKTHYILGRIESKAATHYLAL